MTTYLDRLVALDAPSRLVDWCRANHPTDLRAAWADCPDGRWMLWLLARLDHYRCIVVIAEVCGNLDDDAARRSTTDAIRDLVTAAEVEKMLMERSR